MDSRNAPLEIWNNGKPCLLARKYVIVYNIINAEE